MNLLNELSFHIFLSMINLHYAHECPNIPELCSLTSYNSKIILIKIETYYSQNYAGTLGSSLVSMSKKGGLK